MKNLRKTAVKVVLLFLCSLFMSFTLNPWKVFRYSHYSEGNRQIIEVTLKGWKPSLEKQFQQVNSLQELTAICRTAGYEDAKTLASVKEPSAWQVEEAKVITVKLLSSKAEYRFVRIQ